MLTSSDPGGGASAWTATTLPDASALDGVSCPSASLCVAVNYWGHIFTTSNPRGSAAAWSATRVEPLGPAPPPGLEGVSCPSVSLCVAVDDAGRVIVSKRPTGGAAAWKVTHIRGISPGGLSGVSCPSVSLCVAVDGGGGNIVTSGNPTGGPSAWTVTHLRGIRPTSVSCATRRLCVVLDGTRMITSAHPQGGASAWAITPAPSPVYGGYYAQTAASCTPRAMCMVVDSSGRALIGVPALPPTAGQLRTLLRHQLKPSGRIGTIAALLKHRAYTYSLQMPATGRLTISWYLLPQRAKLPRHTPQPILISSGRAAITSYTATTLTIHLTDDGTRLLKRADHLQLSPTGSFIPQGKRAITATQSFALTR